MAEPQDSVKSNTDACNGFPYLKQEIWTKNERATVVAKSASFGHGSIDCGMWSAGGDRGGSVFCVRTWYILHTYFFVPGLRFMEKS